jgi:uncharacterized protein (DUF1501 family)
MSISVAGSPVFGSGKVTSCLSVAPGGAVAEVCYEKSSICSARLAGAQQLLTLDTGVTLVQADQTIGANAESYNKVLVEALASAPKLSTAFPAGNQLAQQLKQIAEMISVRGALGPQRQIFFASLGGFDTHSDQAAVHSSLLAQLDGALSAFQLAIAELKLGSQVTTFTMSDFNRALEPNTASGTDHAWGTHLIVLGGAVKGGQIYGTYPTLALGGPDDAGSNGRWIPSTSSSQFAATMASWFGVSASNLPAIFPCLSNFSNQSLAFI